MTNEGFVRQELYRYICVGVWVSLIGLYWPLASKLKDKDFCHPVFSFDFFICPCHSTHFLTSSALKLFYFFSLICVQELFSVSGFQTWQLKHTLDRYGLACVCIANSGFYDHNCYLDITPTFIHHTPRQLTLLYRKKKSKVASLPHPTVSHKCYKMFIKK